MQKVHKDLQMTLSEAATHIANDDLTKARDCFVQAIELITVTTGTPSPLPDDVAGTPAKNKPKRSGGKKTPARRRTSNRRRS